MTITTLPAAPAVTDPPATFNTKAFNLVAALPTLVAEINAAIALNDITAAADVHAATSKVTPVDADELPIMDSADTFSLKKVTWANLKATVKTYFDTLYQAAGTYVTPTTLNNGTLAASVTTLTAGGLITASGGLEIAGGSYAAGHSKAYTTAADGLVIIGKTGTVTDIVLASGAGLNVLTVATGTIEVTIPGGLALTANYSATAGGALAIEAVIAPTLTGGWVNVGGTYATAGYWKDAFGVVRSRGLISSGGGNIAFTLPAGYRPPADSLFTGPNTSGGVSVCEVLSTGTVRPITAGDFDLSSISFRTT